MGITNATIHRSYLCIVIDDTRISNPRDLSSYLKECIGNNLIPTTEVQVQTLNDAYTSIKVSIQKGVGRT